MTKFKRNSLTVIKTICVAALGFLTFYKWWEHNLMKTIRESPLDKRADMIARNYEFALSHVQSGMTKQQVAKAIGLPQNTDCEHVWAWAFPSAVPLKGDEGWIDLMRRGADIVSVVFLDGKVIGSPLGIESGASMPPPYLVMSVKNVTCGQHWNCLAPRQMILSDIYKVKKKAGDYGLRCSQPRNRKKKIRMRIPNQAEARNDKG